ncbi:homeobox protein cut-like protein [Xylona heveae TC161]|uniref:Protein CASP n=1 Tax=Xylona heveae (strain CBS 132557 / TC161) TaxID=1328760 RepID=A0A165HYY0_XYLHT|nr:homeobox protein cut-like protein [Xylona heveae TC161]KZF24115.1 homeobox protein cut-like protein [Xylona heveae TC161]
MATDPVEEGKVPFSITTTSTTLGGNDATATLGFREVASHQGGNKFYRALTSWKSIDLTNLLPKFDTTASDIVVHQRETLVQRKELAQKTKDFKKLDDTAKLQDYKSLLKAYQTFIDLLTNNSKVTSSAFLQLYSSISEAPDPYPLLEASLDALLVSEDTFPKVIAENERLKKTIESLTGQVESAESRLNDERDARKSLELVWESKVKEVEASWAAVLDEKRDNWNSRERALEEKVETQERLLKEVKASFEVSQRLDRTGNGSGPVSLGNTTELEMISSELERTSVRLAEIEARNEQLRLELAQATSQAKSSDITIEDDPAFLRIQSENSSLLRKLDVLRFEHDSEIRQMGGRLLSMEKAIGALSDDNEKLQREAGRYSDYADIKRELEVLKSVEFAMGDDEGEEEEDEDDDNYDDKGNGVGHGERSPGDLSLFRRDNPETLEQLLLRRNKKLGDDLAILRASHRELQDRLEVVEKDLTTTAQELDNSRTLAATLENDLLILQQDPGSGFKSSAMSVTGIHASRFPQLRDGARGGRTSPTSSIISGLDPSQTATGESGGLGTGILPMVAAQRDRFRQRNARLEEELSTAYNVVSSLRQEVASLQRDNLNLYERTRYMSTYNRGQPFSSSSAYSANPNPSTVHVSSNDVPSDVGLDKYQSAYEARISPFAAFRGRESARALKRMSLPERIVFSITRLVLANRASRNLFAVYCLALHLLVFGMLYWVGIADVEKHAGNLAEAGVASAAGMGDVKPEWHQEGFSERG